MSLGLSPAAESLIAHPDWIEQELAERSLWEFTRQMWPWIDPAPFKDNWHIGCIAEHLEAVNLGQIHRLIINIPPRHMKSSAVAVAWPVWTWIRRPETHLLGPQVQFLFASYAQALSIRDSVKCRRLIDSPKFQERWGDRFSLTTDQNTKGLFENNHKGRRLAASVDSHLTGEGGNILVVDDPHNVRDKESEIKRMAALDWWDQSASNRLNDSVTGAFVVIGQRVHHQDLCGHLIDKGGWTHLCLPARYESDHPHVSIHDQRTKDGDLLWESRFPEETLQILEADLGSYGCTPAESPVLMSDLSLKPISEVREGDEVVGFAPGEIQEGASYARTHLQPTRVVKTYRHPNASIAKLLMASGEYARCTPDHRWYRKMRNDHPNSTYCAASIRSPLVRVCPPQLPKFKLGDERLAGWLCGFYEGEGSVSFSRRNKGCRPVGSITFYQGAGRNAPLCERLEDALNHFGFDYSIHRDDRKDPSRGVNFEYRVYRIKGQSLPLFQRFLHITQTVKWRDRMIETAYGARFGNRDRVEAIESDGVEDAFALQTETGNYIVWGLASSNSAGQMQQRPAPRSGGMFDRNWWDIVEAAPAGGVVVRGWDLAGTEEAAGKKIKASWTAGCKMKLSKGTYYIEDVNRFRGSPATVERGVRNTAEQDGYSVLVDLPQDPGQAGKAQAQYLVKQLAGFNIRYSPESGAKEVRAEALSAQAEAGNVKLVRGAWNTKFIEEGAFFPNSDFSDQIDAASRAFHRLIKMRRRVSVSAPTVIG